MIQWNYCLMMTSRLLYSANVMFFYRNYNQKKSKTLKRKELVYFIDCVICSGELHMLFASVFFDNVITVRCKRALKSSKY